MDPCLTKSGFIHSLKAGSEQAKRMGAGVADHRHTPRQEAEEILDLLRTGDERADLVPEQPGGALKG